MADILLWLHLVLCLMTVEKGFCLMCRNETFAELTNDNFTVHVNSLFVTNTGHLCHNWTKVQANYTILTLDNDTVSPYYDSMDGARNYCRQTDPGYWWDVICITTITNWELTFQRCNKRICREPHCQDAQLAHYSGKISQTNDGLTCQSWTSQEPQEHQFDSDEFFPLDGVVEEAHNYCRNVGNDDLPWCFTTEPSVRWQYCDAIICRGEETGLYSTTEHQENVVTIGKNGATVGQNKAVILLSSGAVTLSTEGVGSVTKASSLNGHQRR